MPDENEQGRVKGEWEKTWDARLAALSAHFGTPSDRVHHSLMPFFMGGNADVVEFPEYRGGIAYVTAELTGGGERQMPNMFESYELMICTRNDNEYAPAAISLLARHTYGTTLSLGDTMDVGKLFQDRSIRALLVCLPPEGEARFELNGEACGVLLCVGITKSELRFKLKNGAEALLNLLQGAGVFPFTIPNRPSLIPSPWYRFWE